MTGATLFQMDNEFAALLVEAHHKLVLLEGLLQYAPNKNSFCELMPLKECNYSRMIDYDASDFSDILVRIGADKDDIELLNNLMSAGIGYAVCRSRL